MEFVIIIVLVLAVAIALLYTKFANFKSKLMNELGRRGLAFDKADALYTMHRDKVHDMHNNGHSIDNIVDSIIFNTNSLRESASNYPSPPAPSKNHQLTEKEKRVIEMVTESVAVQLLLSPQSFIDAHDNFSVGYLIGYTDAAMQKTGINNNSTGGIVVFTIVCDHFLGEELGSATVANFIHNQMNLPKSFRDGLVAGGQDIFDWIGSDKKATPSRLSKHYFERRESL